MDMMCRRTLIGHKDDVMHLAAVGLRRRYPTAGDGNFTNSSRFPPQASTAALVASSSADGSIRVWSASWVCTRILLVSTQVPPQPMFQQRATGMNGALASSSNSSKTAGSSGVNPKGGLSAALAARPPASDGGFGSMHHSRAHIGTFSKHHIDADHLATAALTVAMSRNLIVSGYSDASIRLWHTDDVFMAAMDYTQQISNGPLGEDPSIWQLSSLGLHELGATAPGYNSSSHNSLALLCSPPMSPKSGLPLLSIPGGGSFTELTPRGGAVTCARSKTPNPISPAGVMAQHNLPPGTPTAGPASVNAAVDGMLNGRMLSPSVGLGLCGPACLACGSQDQQLVRSLREFVAIRTVSADRVRGCGRMHVLYGSALTMCCVCLVAWNSVPVE